MQFTDQTGHVITLPHMPKRIVSLVPSQTELLFDLGLADQVVGVTMYCTQPDPMPHHVTRIGGTKKVNMRRLKQLSPDLIIGNKEENDKEQIQDLRQAFPTWLSNIVTIEDALDMIGHVGKMTGSTKWKVLTNEIREAFSTPVRPIQQAAYLIWNDPVMVAGIETFIHSMMDFAGFHNSFSTMTRYPQISADRLRDANPEVILLSSEPFPFVKSHVRQFSKLIPEAKTLLVDATFFSWYGSRMARAPAYFRQLKARLL